VGTVRAFDDSDFEQVGGLARADEHGELIDLLVLRQEPRRFSHSEIVRCLKRYLARSGLWGMAHRPLDARVRTTIKHRPILQAMGFSYATKIAAMAAAGGICSFPGCDDRLFDFDTGVLVGQVAHIRGAKAGAKRHDPTYRAVSELENALPMCQRHHTVIDARDGRHTVDQLVEWKEAREAEQAKIRAGPWIRSQGLQIVIGGGPDDALFWQDDDGESHPYSPKQLAQMQAAFKLVSFLAGAGEIAELLASIDPKIHADEGAVGHIKKRVEVSLGRDRQRSMAKLVPILEQLHDVTFAEILASWIVAGDGPHDFKRTIEDVAYRGEQHRRSAGH